MSKFNDIISRMMEACGVEKSTELAEIIGKDQSTVSRWRSRKKVPDGVIAQVSALTNVNCDWIRTGEGEMRPPIYEKQPLLPPMLAEMVAETLAQWEGEKLELDEGAVVLVRLYNQMTPEQQRDLIAEAAMNVIAKDVEDPK